MKKPILLTILFFVSYIVTSQEFMKKIPLKEGSISTIKYKDVTINTLLQVYDKKSAAHLNGDIYLKVYTKDKTIAEFYIDESTKEYYTKVYENYFLTFMHENNNKHLIIEQAHFGKAFALSNNGHATIGNKNDVVTIEITDYIHEWGENAPIEGEDEGEEKSYFDDVQYTLNVKARGVVKNFSFYSSEVKDNFTIDLEDYSIQILSDVYKNSSCLIEMIINRKAKK